MTGFAKGIGDVLWATALLLRSPRLWGYVLAPALVAAPLVVATLYILFGPVMAYADDAGAALPSWLSFLGGLLQVLAVVPLLGAGYVVFLAATALCTAPFCEQLSESVELTLGGETPPAFSVKTLLADLVMGVGHSLRRISSYLLVMALLFAAALIVPVIGALIFTIGGAWVTTRFAAYDALDSVWARKSLSYNDKMQNLRKVRGRAYGIGALTALLLVVPVVNLLALPLAAIAATKLHLRELG